MWYYHRGNQVGGGALEWPPSGARIVQRARMRAPTASAAAPGDAYTLGCVVRERNRQRSPSTGAIIGRNAAWLAWPACALSLSLMASGLLVIIVGWSTPLPAGWNPWTNQAIEAVGVTGAPILGAIVASRRPGNPYGWLWLGVGSGWALTAFAQAYAAYALVVEPGSLPAPRTVAVLVEAVGFVTVMTVAPFLLLLFPDGRPPSRRWRHLVWAAIAAGVLMIVSLPFVGGPGPVGGFANPLAAEGAAGAVAGIGALGGELILYGAIVLSALSLLLRYRRAGREQRQQLKWFAYAGAFVGAYLLLSFFLPGVLESMLGTIVLLGLYAAITIAMLKHHLYDIDLVINRTLVYGALTVVIAGLFQATDAAAHHLFLTLTGQESWVSVIVSALAIAALFEPAKRRIKHLVDRRLVGDDKGDNDGGPSGRPSGGTPGRPRAQKRAEN